MKAFLLVGIIFSAFLIFLGYTANNDAGNALGNAAIVAGVLIAVFVIIIWLISIYKEKKEKEKF
jgi:quinol-cytochrome oxidoreductase complex cytochrome b subunit